MATKGQIGSTALVIAAWAVLLYFVYKFLPGAIRSVNSSSYLPGYRPTAYIPEGTPFPALYNGVAGYDGRAFGQSQFQNGLTPAQIVSNPNLSSDLTPQSLAGLQTIANAAAGRNPDGSAYTAAEAAPFVATFDPVSANQQLPYQPLLNVPDSDLLSYTPGDSTDGDLSQTGIGDDGSGGLTELDVYDDTDQIPEAGD